ncbi:MAG TPA: hypothetical protein VE684_05130 [Crenalkalicoccus sp.]|nr:hypothetical protein [Crenalkalicoccus sp.]
MAPLRRLLLLAPLLAAAWPAAAQIREGAYEIEGQNPDGSTYAGTFLLQTAPSAAWYVAWQVGDVRLLGLGVIEGGVLAVGFTLDGRPGVAAYQVQPDGTLRGVWSTGGGLGTETLKPR